MSLFTPFQLGRITLPNRIVMAPMTRSRAIGWVPNALITEYYAQRATAGLIITEGTAPNADGIGYSRTPGIYSDAQIAGWRDVTDAVHAAGGRIVVQLMHVGRISHPANAPEGTRVLAPSAITAEGQMWTDTEGMQPFATPSEMTLEDIAVTKEAFVQAARNAIAAGFDGVELHSANGYLLEQFLNPSSNQRTDSYGGSVENRARFLTEVAAATAEAIGADRVGVRLSPFNTYNGIGSFDEVEAQYAAAAAGLRGLMYVHVIRNPNPEFPTVLSAIREAFGGPIILNGGFGPEDAAATIENGGAELVSFGRPFVSNPDLVARIAKGAALAEPDASKFFSAAADGFTDYPTL